MTDRGFFTELRRRVLPIAGAYIAITWLVTEVAGFLMEQTGAPPWILRLLAIAFMVGFPVAMVLAWIIQLGPDGKRTLDPSKGHVKSVIGAIALGVVTTAGLSWLILPRIGDEARQPVYQPIPNSVAFLPLTMTLATEKERAIGNTLHIALGNGLDQSAELILLDLRKLKERPGDLSEFGRSLNASALLTGNILQAPGKTRIEFELLDVAQNEVTWSQSFDWKPTRIRDTGSEIANSVLSAMALRGLTQESFAGTNNPEAYDAFLSGKQQAASLNISLLLKAMDDFQQAINLDPDFVLAYVELAETIRWYIRNRGPEEEEREVLRDRSRQALETAQKLDSESAAVVSALGLFSRDRSLATQAFEHALELDPNHAKSYHRLGRVMASEGQLQQSERLTRMALELDPLNGDWHNDLAGVLFDLGRDEEALAEIHRSIELEPGLVWNHHRLSIWSGYHFGRLDEAVIYAREAYSLDPDNGGVAWEVMGWYLDLGAREEALVWLDRQLELGPGDPWRWFGAGVVAKYFGEKEKALGYIKKTLEIEPGLTWAMREMDLHDIEEGQAELALERWQTTYPALFINETPTVDRSNFGEAIMLGQLFMVVGETERAEYLLTSCLDILRTLASEDSTRDSSILDTEQEVYASLGMKEETLEAVQRSIMDRNWRATSVWYDLPIYDFLRDDSEFQELMEIVHNDLAEQLKRVRTMECNGELAPAPGVAKVLVCD